MKKNVICSPAGRKESASYGFQKRLCCLLALFLCIGSTYAQDNTTGNIEQKIINIGFESQRLDDALLQLEKASGFHLVYPSEPVEKARLISVPQGSRTVAATLTLILQRTNLGFRQSGNSIVLFTSEKQAAVTPPPQPTHNTIHGVIKDENGITIPAAAVVIKGTNKNTIANNDGEFELANVASDATLLISSIGYKLVEYPLNGRTKVDIQLESTTTALDEVVVTGYQTIAKERATGAYAIVGAKELEKKIVIDATSAIEGQVAGVSTYGDQIMIRGTSTFLTDANSAKPLVVIDGLPTERDINDVNMNDVESFTILKDAAAAAIYGVRASNGVIVITTKKGKEGKTQVQFTSDFRWTINPNLEDYKYASTSQIMGFELASLAKNVKNSTLANGNELLYLNDYVKGIGDALNSAINYVSPLYNLRHELAKGTITQDQYNKQMALWRNTDYRQEYMDYAWRTPFRQSYNLSVSNASERQNTYASFNYIGNQLQSQVENDNVMKGYLKTNQKVTKWLSVDLGIDMQYGHTVRSGNSTSSGYRSFTNLEPYTDLVDENGDRVYRDYVNSSNPLIGGLRVNSKVLGQIAGIPEFQSYRFNTLDELERNQQTTNSLNLRSFVALNFKLYTGLTFKSSFDYEYGINSSDFLVEEDAYAMRFLRNEFAVYNASSGKIENSTIPAGAYYQKNESKSANYVFRNQLDYRATIAEKHDISIAAGMEIKENYIPQNLTRTYFGYNGKTLGVTALDEQTIVGTGYWSYIYNNAQTSATPQGTRVRLASTAFGQTLSETLNRYVSLYAAGGYTYNNRYNFTGSIRLDQTNLFAPDPKYRYRPLWSIGAKWNMDKETFMQGITWLDMLDVRASYGVTGNVDQSSSPYVLASTSSQSFYTSGEAVSYTSVATAPNPELRWEKTTSYGFGVDFSIFKRFLSGKIDFYYKYSDDLLTTVDTDITTGYSFAKVNNGAVSNKGFEISLSSPWYKTKDWTFTSGFIFSYNDNTVERSDYAAKTAEALVGGSTQSYRVVGNPMYSLYAYHYNGLTTGGTNDQNGVPIIVDANGNAQHVMNADGTVSILSNTLMPEDVRYMGSLVPIWNGSFNQSIKYKSWELTTMFTFYGGHKIRKITYDFSVTAITGDMMEYIATSWRPDNIRSTIPKSAIYYTNTNNLSILSREWRNSDVNVVDGDMIRLRNIAISYTVPQKYSKKAAMEGLKVTAQVNNLWFWSAAGDGIDPEVQTRNSSLGLNTKSPMSFWLRLDITL